MNTPPRARFDATSMTNLPEPTPSPNTRRPSRHSRRQSTATIDMLGNTKPQLRQVTYDDRNHVSVLLQMHGSVWPKVFPFALANALLTILLYILKHNYSIDVTMSPSGHKFMSVLVSFLVVSRAQITYARFMEARGYLSATYKSCRELAHHACVLSMDDKSVGAKVWRQNVAYRTILLLRVTMAVMEFQSSKEAPWEVKEMSEEERDDMRSSLCLGETNENNDNEKIFPTEQQKRVQKWAHGKRTLDDESFRAPIVMAFNLRREIMKQREGGLLKKKEASTGSVCFRHVNEELKLLDYVTDFNKAFHGLKKLTTTPFPFPLVQMARTFLFFWVFTLPFGLCHDLNDAVQVTLIVFIITYGFVGLEYVSMELDDPFGDDPNDFDDLGMAQMCFEDIYISIYRCDGEKSASELRDRVLGRIQRGDALSNFQKDIQNDFSGNITSRY